MFLKKIWFFLLFPMSVGVFAKEVEHGTVSWPFDIGDKCKILQYRANVRAEPSIDSNVIAILSLNDQVEILEYSEILEVIRRIHGTWLKIKYEKITGYTFSGNLANESFATDIDNNGITDYFYFRNSRLYEFSYDNTYYFLFDQYNAQNDIFVYINNKKIYIGEIHIPTDLVNEIKFEKGDNCVFINFIDHYKCGTEKWIYKVMNDGLIMYMGNKSD